MGTIRRMGSNWHCLIRIKDHPHRSKIFKKYDDAKHWSIEPEPKIIRKDVGITKIKYATLNKIG
jgi:hypothetical protein